MNEATGIVLGASIGGVLTLTATYAQVWLQRRSREADEASERAQLGRAERKEAYLRLLATVRRLRFSARMSSPSPDDEALRSELSTLTYEVELIASPAMAAAAQELAEATRQYLRCAATLWGAHVGTNLDRLVEEREQARVAVRGLVDDFVVRARSDLEIRETK